MKFLSVIVSALVIVVAGNLLHSTTADQITIPPEKIVVPAEVAVEVTPADAVQTEYATDCSDGTCALRPVRKVVKKVAKVRVVVKAPIKVLGKARKVVKVVKVVKVFNRRPARRLLGRVFCRRCR